MRHPNTHRRINIITLGCAKNIVDSEVLAGRLAQTGFSLVHERKINPGDIVIVNTCGFIHDAKEESIDTILNLARFRRGGKIAKLIVMGCLTELYATEIREEIPEIDEVFGANKMVDVMRSLTNRYDAHHLVERVPFTPKHTAYLKTSEGCNRRCSFCTIPLIRGKHVSRTLESLVEEAEMLASGGVRELMLIAQDLTYYGVDLYGKRKIAELVHRLAEIRQLKRIRLHYAYPADFPLELLNVMQRHPKVCKYLDIPVQHISDHILQSMKRGIGKSATIMLLEEIRKRVPGIAIRTTLITGFPGETEKDFEELQLFIREQRFERLGVFAYSNEEFASAYHLPKQVPEAIKMKRLEALMAIQQEIAEEHNRSFIGKNIEVLVDRKEGAHYVGRTEYDAPEVDNEVIIQNSKRLKAGSFAQILITDATSFDLVGINSPLK